MKRLTAGAAIASLAVAGAVVPGAVAQGGPKKPSPRAHVYRGTILGTEPDSQILGKVHLVDGKKNDKLSIHLRGLTAGQTYGWDVQEVDGVVESPCTTAPAGAETATGWTYASFQANEAGDAGSHARSTSFSYDTDDTYWVEVHTEAGDMIACAALRPAYKGSHTTNSRSTGRALAKGRKTS
jgi:hypothetical protein